MLKPGQIDLQRISICKEFLAEHVMLIVALCPQRSWIQIPGMVHGHVLRKTQVLTMINGFVAYI